MRDQQESRMDEREAEPVISGDEHEPMSLATQCRVGIKEVGNVPNLNRQSRTASRRRAGGLGGGSGAET